MVLEYSSVNSHNLLFHVVYQFLPGAIKKNSATDPEAKSLKISAHKTSFSISIGIAIRCPMKKSISFQI